MSTEIENRIVQIQFNNKDFEKNAAESIQTLERFEKSLKFDGARKGFEEVENAAKKMDLSAAEASVNQLTLKFSALQIAGITAISKIVDYAMNMGGQLVKSLSLDQITGGFERYEQKLVSTRTIMNATGLSIDEVSDRIERLMWYTDETSYSFDDMIANIAKFTSRGIDLDTSVSAIMGIANATGLAGGNAEKAGHAMQGFSKSLGQGYMDRMSWNWIQTAGVDIQRVTQHFMDMGVAAGTLQKDLNGVYKTLKGTIVTAGSFDVSLTDKWLTKDVLVKALDELGSYGNMIYDITKETKVSAAEAIEYLDALGLEVSEISRLGFQASQEYKTFTDAVEATKDAVKSGWARTYEAIFGDVEEAKALWTSVGDELYSIFAEGAEYRNSMLAEWKKQGGRDAAIEGIANLYQSFKNIIVAIKDGFREMFPKMTVDRLLELTRRFRDFTAQLKLSDEALNTIKVTTKALLTPVKIAVELLKVGTVITKNLVIVLFALVNGLLSFLSSGEKVEALFRKLFGDERYERLVASLTTIITRLSDAISLLWSRVKGFIKDLNIPEYLLAGLQILANVAVTLLGGLLEGLVTGLEALATLDFSKVKEFFEGIYDKLPNFLKTAISGVGSLTKSISGFFKVLFTEGIPQAFSDLINFFKMVFTQDIPGVFNKLAYGFKVVKDAVVDFVSKITFGQVALFAFGASILLLVIRLIKIGKLINTMIKAVTGIFDAISGIGRAVKKFMMAKTIVKLATALTLLAAALVVLTLVDTGRVVEAASSIAILSGSLAILSFVMAKINKIVIGESKGKDATAKVKQFRKTINSLLGMSLSIVALAGALAIVSTADLDGLGLKLLAMAGVMAAMVGVTTLLSKISSRKKVNEDFTRVIIGFASFAGTLALLVRTLKKMEDINVEGLIPRIIGISILLLAMALASKTMTRVVEKGSKVKATGGLIKLALGMLAFLGVIALISKVNIKLSTDALAQFGILLGAILGIAVFSRIVAGATNTLGKNMIAISAGLLLLKLAIEALGSMKLLKLIKGAIAAIILIGAFTAELFVVTLVSGGGKSVSGARNILSIALAINLLLLAIYVLGSMEMDKVLIGTAIVSALIFMFSLVVKAANGVGKTKSSIVSISVCIGLLAIMMALMTGLPLVKAIISTALLSELMLSLGFVLRSMSKLKSYKLKNMIPTIVTLVVVIGMTAGMIALLSKNDWKASIASGAALAVAISSLSLVMRSMDELVNASKKWQKGKEFWASLGKSLVAMFGMLLEVGIAVTALSYVVNQDWKRTLSGAIGMAAMLAAMSLVLKPLVESITQWSEGRQDWANIGKMATMMGTVLLEVGIVVGLLSHLSGDKVSGAIALAAAMAVLMLGLSYSVKAIAKVNIQDFTSILKTIGSMLLLLTAFGGFVLGAGLVMSLIGDKAEEFARNAIILTGTVGLLSPMLIVIAGVAWVVNAIAPGMKSAIPALLSTMVFLTVFSLFLAALGGLFMGIDWLFSKAHFDLVSLIEKVGDILAAIGNVIGRVIGGVIGGIQAEIETIKDKQAIDSMKYAVQSIADIIPSLKEFEQVDSSIIQGLRNFSDAFDVISDTFGNDFYRMSMSSGMAEFIGDLTIFAQGLSEFSKMTKDINALDLLIISEAARILSEASENVSRYISVAGDNKQLETFGRDLVSFGKYLIFYNREVSSISNWDAVSKSAVAASELVDVANSISGTGGMVELFNGYGEGDFESFGNKLKHFGLALVSYSFYLRGITSDDWKQIDNSVTYSKKLIALGDSIFAHGGLAGWVIGNQGLEGFSSEIEKFGKALNSYLGDGGIGQITNWDLIETSVDAAEQLGSLGTYWSNLGITYSAAVDFSQVLPLIGQGIAGYYTAISQIGNSDDIDFQALKSTVDITKELIATISTLIDGEDINWSGAAVLNGLTEKIVAIVNVASRRINDLKDTFELMGKYGAQGYIKGLIGDMSIYTNAGTKMGVAVLNAIAAALAINSPSRRTFELAQFTGDGFVGGLTASVPAVKKAGIRLGSAAIEGIAGSKGGNRMTMDPAVRAHAAELAGMVATAVESPQNQNKVAQAGQVLGETVAESITEAIDDSLGTANGTPSLITTEDGKYIIQGIANGITEEMSAEEAARKKAENIISAFNSGIEAASKKSTTAEKEKALWDILNPNATDTEKSVKEYELLAAKVPQQLERLRLAKAELRTLSESGYASQAQLEESYQTLLEEEAAYAQLIQQMLELERSVETDYNSARVEAIKAEYELWSQTEGLTATEGQKAIKQNELYQSQLDLQARAVQEAERAYNSAVEKFGEDTTEAYRARKTLAEANLEMWNIAKEWGQAMTGQDIEEAIKDAQSNYRALIAEYQTPIQSQTVSKTFTDFLKEHPLIDENIYKYLKENDDPLKDNEQEYYDLLKEYYCWTEDVQEIQKSAWEVLKDQGFTDEQIYEYLREKSGLTAVENVRNMINESLENARTAAEDVSESKLDQLSDALNELSADAVELGLSQGIASGGSEGITEGLNGMFTGLDISKIIGDVLSDNLDISFATRMAVEASTNAASAAGSSAGTAAGIAYADAMSTNLGEQFDSALNGEDGIINQIAEGIEDGFQNLVGEDNPIYGGFAGWVNNGINTLTNFLDNSPWGSWVNEHFFKPLLNAVGIETETTTPEIEKSGMMMGRAWRAGMDTEFDLVHASVEATGSDAVGSMNNAITQLKAGVEQLSGDYHPTVTVVTDMSDVERSFSDIERRFASTTFEITASAGAAAAMAANRNSRSNDNQNGGSNDNSGEVINNYTQNIYSPKTLNPTEIYRQTRNLLDY